jgi:hypothetical protein
MGILTLAVNFFEHVTMWKIVESELIGLIIKCRLGHWFAFI